MEMTPYTLHHGDCLAVLRTLPDASVDAVAMRARETAQGSLGL